jgi:DNA-binding transcriptional MerR regulator
MSTKEERCDYRIEEVAARTGFTKRTLRYYEEIGLITPAGRSEGNYRLYSEADVARLQRIKRLKDVLGIPLSSIKRLAEVEETLDVLGTELLGPLDPQQRRTRLLQAYAELEQQLRTIDERLATLTHMRAELADRLARIDQLLHPGDRGTRRSH